VPHLAATSREEDEMAKERLTDPYGLLEWAVGDGDDFVCFDFYVTQRRVLLHAVINSETGHFIDTLEKMTVSRRDAFAEAVALVDRALDWAYANDVRLDLKGWNQDPYYFARCVRAIVDGKGTPARRVREWRTRGYK
jgi:hypothetical protein